MEKEKMLADDKEKELKDLKVSWKKKAPKGFSDETRCGKWVLIKRGMWKSQENVSKHLIMLFKTFLSFESTKSAEYYVSNILKNMIRKLKVKVSWENTEIYLKKKYFWLWLIF